MAAPLDTRSSFQDYAHPERLVSTEWLAEHLDHPNLQILECDADSLLYDIGHVVGAQRIDAEQDLISPVVRDMVEERQFTALMRRLGIRREDTIILYGDHSNCWAAFACWVFTLFGHEDVRLLDGGRDSWFLEERPSSFSVRMLPESHYPHVRRDDSVQRIFRNDMLESLGEATLVDVRSTAEYSGASLGDVMTGSSTRPGHIPTACSLPWNDAVGAGGHFLDRESLDRLYSPHCPDKNNQVITYCGSGQRASHSWFVLKYLLGYDNVANYDGSWLEWGNAVRLPIVLGSSPGQYP